ncbi:hypothetical protein RhiirA4_460014 [Rhizophagus irregularis]|uniref:Uncharacterized protein n=1 Tax=Rhizophagus irregularis TaxID=588596 RepID=A0A2I1GFQ0_9GLOM|nr:hypothetical protein RhiirA4_460014 [Rhizophagus irregularis]
MSTTKEECCKQQCADFRADKCEEHNRYVRSLATIISCEETPAEAIERASSALTLV